MPSHAAGAIPGLISGEPFEEDDGTGEFGLIEAANHRAGGLSGLASLAPSWLFSCCQQVVSIGSKCSKFPRVPFFWETHRKYRKQNGIILHFV